MGWIKVGYKGMSNPMPRQLGLLARMKAILVRSLASALDGLLGSAGMHFIFKQRLNCKIAFDETSVLSVCGASLRRQNSRSLDIGCGLVPRNPFGASEALGVDICKSMNENVVRADIVRDGLPFSDGEFDYVVAYDFLEHIPRVSMCEGTRFPFVELMNEVFRILNDDGVFYSHTPAFPFPEAFVDPTHVNIITEDTFPRYFCSAVDGLPGASRYGFTGNFELVSQQWLGFRLLSVLRKKSVLE